MLNCEKCHLMVPKGVVLTTSTHATEVDRVKTEIIEKLPPPTFLKEVRSFLGNVRFYRRFMKDFSKISKPLCNLLEKEKPFKFDDKCLEVLRV